jgi:ABC-type branched-subunit amino acid transport system substrate-binding protein
MAIIIFDKFGAIPQGTLPIRWAFIIEQGDFSTELFIFAKQVAAAAIEKAGSLNRAAIRDALAATDMMTVMGQVKFGPNNARLNAIRPVIQWQNGSMELVWPDNQKTKTFVYSIRGSK